MSEDNIRTGEMVASLQLHTNAEVKLCFSQHEKKNGKKQQKETGKWERREIYTILIRWSQWLQQELYEELYRHCQVCLGQCQFFGNRCLSFSRLFAACYRLCQALVLIANCSPSHLWHSALMSRSLLNQQSWVPMRQLKCPYDAVEHCSQNCCYRRIPDHLYLPSGSNHRATPSHCHVLMKARFQYIVIHGNF